MKANTFLKVLNPILAIVFLLQIVTGLMHGIIPRELFEKIHGGIAGVLIICVIIHLVLNWNWFNINFLKKT